MRVLVVDDTAFMRLTLRRTLERFGHEVVGEAADGEEAVQLYQELRPDLVTMDITMPKMDGITAIREIRKIDPRAKIIVCSAMGQKPMVIEALEAGAQDFLVKPFDAERVREAIERLNGAV
ncbi:MULTISPECIES: response regulator [Limnochorda]|uniref:response regulator n=1 Tax=Limnochorda TaxID=1676651 RepID=UPI0026EF8944|nr:response regulator [Limnochorda pilosa]